VHTTEHGYDVDDENKYGDSGGPKIKIRKLDGQRDGRKISITHSGCEQSTGRSRTRIHLVDDTGRRKYM